MRLNQSSLLPIYTRKIPTIAYTTEPFTNIAAVFFPIILNIVFIYTVFTTTQELVKEKRARLKESLRMMGCKNWVIWVSWFIKYFLQFLLLSIIISVILSAGKVFTNVNVIVLVVLFLLYSIGLIMYCAFWSTLFSNPTVAGLIASIMFIGGVIPAFIFSPSTTIDPVIKTGFCAPFFLNSCMSYSLVTLLQTSSRGVSITFGNISNGLDAVNTFNIALAYGMLLLQSLAYLILTWYIEAVFPGDYGVPKPFYFFLQPSYWFDLSSSAEGGTDIELERLNVDGTDAGAFEPEPTGVNFGIKIDKLGKVFKSAQGTKVAVNGLSLKLVEGQITSLLGHNGAGKTTTMSMLTGLYNPTSGDAFINGKSIRREMDSIRTDLGLCPQHNVLWDKMTVHEHLSLYGSLKGLCGSKLKQAIEEMLDDLKLRDKVKWKTMQLSGGMKRKLSVGIALIGGSRVVIFDEPTAGMDPYARRSTWDLLIKHKKDRTILLTTHYMDEADLLGDRIAIMAEGQCKCAGSSLFLKSRYGVGYHLTIAKTNACDENMVSNFVLHAIPNGRMVSSAGAEMAFILPSDATPSFPSLFENMEGQKTMLGIENFGLSVTTLEEVFIRVGQLAEAEKTENKSMEESTTPESFKRKRLDGELSLLTGPALWLQRVFALLAKRVTVSFRSYFVMTIQLVVPMVCLIGALLLLTSSSSSNTNPPLTLGVPYFKGGSGSSVSMRTADFRRGNEKSVNIVNTVSTMATKLGVLHTDFSAQVNKTFTRIMASPSDTSECCSQSNLILKPECIRHYQSSSTACQGVPGNSYEQCAKCVHPGGGNSQPGTPLFGTREASTSRSPSYFGSCGECPASPTDVQASYTGYMQQLLLETGTLSTPLQDNEPAIFSFHTMSADNVSQYNAYDLHQRDVPYECLVGTGFPLPGSIHTILNTRGNPTFCDMLQGNYPGSEFYARVWSWGQDYHAGPSALNTFSNVYLESAMREENPSGTWTAGDYSIPVSFHPVVPPTDQAAQVSGGSNTLIFTLIFGLGLSFVVGSFTIFPLDEKRSKAKHIQYVSGVGPVTYWISNLIADFLVYCVAFGILAIVYSGFANQYPTLKAIQSNALLVLYVGGLAGISFAYFTTLFFKSPILSFAMVSVILFVGSLACSVANFALTQTKDRDGAQIAHLVGTVLPPYAMANGIVSLYQNEKLSENCLNRLEAANVTDPKRRVLLLGQCHNFSNFTDPLSYEYLGVGYHLLFSEVIFGGLFILVCIIEQGWLQVLLSYCFSVNKSAQSTANEDEDVKEERSKVHAMKPSKDKQALVAVDLTKSYRGKLQRPSSDHICLAVPQGECFGLLGVNGAGKTTTFSMLTGEVKPSAGNAYIMGYSIRSQLSQVQQSVGFCPQFDALIDKMTSYELLTMFARLRGIRPSEVKSVVDGLIEELDLKKWASRLCGTYSGGNKRKLSTAIALVGNPPLIFLDEPTAGMDPAARRFLWDFLTKVLHSGRSIVMTSHSMEECEALCTRLAIMVNGQFKCLGSLQHIKNKFGKGFNLTVKIRPPGDDAPPDAKPNTEPLKQFVQKYFPSHEIEDEHFGQVQFRINQQDGDGITWSFIFHCLEENRGRLDVIDYQLSQTTLEQVFLKFAKKQETGQA